jgi:uncharacterized protein (TIGR02611 family)
MAATLHFSFREHWRDLKRGRPGRRFQDRYERARHDERRSGLVQRFALIVVGLVCIVIGLVLSVMPGPAILFFFVAGGLLATESRWIARVMDWFEVKVRQVVAWAKRRWRVMPGWKRLLVVIVAACCAAAFAYLVYGFMRA